MESVQQSRLVQIQADWFAVGGDKYQIALAGGHIDIQRTGGDGRLGLQHPISLGMAGVDQIPDHKRPVTVFQGTVDGRRDLGYASAVQEILHAAFGEDKLRCPGTAGCGVFADILLHFGQEMCLSYAGFDEILIGEGLGHQRNEAGLPLEGIARLPIHFHIIENLYIVKKFKLRVKRLLFAHHQ